MQHRRGGRALAEVRERRPACHLGQFAREVGSGLLAERARGLIVGGVHEGDRAEYPDHEHQHRDEHLHKGEAVVSGQVSP